MRSKRRKFELLLADLRQMVAVPTGNSRDNPLIFAVWNLADFEEELLRDATKVRQVLEVACRLRASNAPGRVWAEEKLMANLVMLAELATGTLEATEFARVPFFPASPVFPLELDPPFRVLQALHEFARGCFEFTRPRDSFSGRRRAFAFEILRYIGRVVDLPEVVLLAEEFSEKETRFESYAAEAFLKTYFAVREEPDSENQTEELLARVEQTDSLATAIDALEQLVVAGALSVEQAQAHAEEWRRRHRQWAPRSSPGRLPPAPPHSLGPAG